MTAPVWSLPVSRCQHSTARTPRAILARLVIYRSSQRPSRREAFPPPSTLDPPVGLAKGGTPEANAGRAAPASAASSHQASSPSTPLSFSSVSPAAWLIRQAARIIPLRIPPSPEGESSRLSFPRRSIINPGGLRAELTSPIPLPDSLGAARRRRPVQASAPRLAIFFPSRRRSIPR